MIVLYGSIWQDCPYTGRSTGSYIVFYQGGPIDQCTHVPVTVSLSSAESDYNETRTAGMYIAHLRMINNELMKKYTYVVTGHTPLIILDIK